MKKFWQIIKNEAKHFSKDSGAKLIMILGVFAYSMFYAVPYAHEIIKEVPIAVINQDNSNFSQKFVQSLDATDYIKIQETVPSIEEAKKEFYRDNIKAFILIPKDFEKDVLSGKQTSIAFYGDAGYLIIYKAVLTGIMQTAGTIEAKIEIAKLMKQGINKKTAISIKQPFEFIPIALYNPQGGYATYIYPAVLILILHQTLIVGLGLLQGTRNEKNAEYADKSELGITLFGRSTFYVLLYLIYSFFLFLLMPAIIKYPMSYNILGLLLILIPMLYCAAFFSHAISFIFKSRENALLIMVVTSLVFVFLPGIIWPKEAIPSLINIFAMFIPATSAIDALIKINQIGIDFWSVRFNFLWLLALCVFYFNIAKINIQKQNNQ